MFKRLMFQEVFEVLFQGLSVGVAVVGRHAQAFCDDRFKGMGYRRVKSPRRRVEKRSAIEHFMGLLRRPAEPPDRERIGLLPRQQLVQH